MCSTCAGGSHGPAVTDTGTPELNNAQSMTHTEAHNLLEESKKLNDRLIM